MKLFSFQNDSGEEIEAFGLMEIVDVTEIDDMIVFMMDKPGNDPVLKPYINIGGKVSAEESASSGIAKFTGSCSNDWPLYVAYNVDDGAPAIGETWGPKSGETKLYKGNDGFVIIGGHVVNTAVTPNVGRVLVDYVGDYLTLGRLVNGNLSPGGSCQVQRLYKGNAGTVDQQNAPVTVYDTIGDKRGTGGRPTGTDGDKCLIRFKGVYWEFVQLYCSSSG